VLLGAPPELAWGGEAEQAIQRLDEQLHKEPRFKLTLRDAVPAEGGTARLSCVVDGTTHRHHRSFFIFFFSFGSVLYKCKPMH
jgi:hypothetical protein